MKTKSYLLTSLVVLMLASGMIYQQSCKKKAQLITFKGKIINGATGQPVEGAFVTLASTSVQSWVYSASFQDITNTQTDASGNFNIETERLPASAYRIYVYKQNYYEHFTVINAEFFSNKDVLDENYELFEQAEVTLFVKNNLPNDVDDKIIFRIVKGAYECTSPCPSSYMHGMGIDFDTTLTCNTYGSRFFVVESMVTKNNHTVQKFDSVFIQAFQNNSLEIHY